MTAWTPTRGRVLAIWPAPIDHDACFAAAGFHEFAASNQLWDAEFSDLVRSLMQSLAQVGPPRLHSGQYPVEAGALAALARLFGRQRGAPSLLDALLAAARDDSFPACVVQFGRPAEAVLRTSSGHPLLWVWTAANRPDREQLLSAVAGSRPIVHAPLDWQALG